MLELPTTPASQQGGNDALTMPRLAPQPGQELELPSRALRNQSGYEQVTVTVTDQNGRYITGLQKGDFRIYVDGRVHVRRGLQPVTMIKLGDQPFTDRLVAKFSLPVHGWRERRY